MLKTAELRLSISNFQVVPGNRVQTLANVRNDSDIVDVFTAGCAEESHGYKVIFERCQGPNGGASAYARSQGAPGLAVPSSNPRSFDRTRGGELTACDERAIIDFKVECPFTKAREMKSTLPLHIAA